MRSDCDLSSTPGLIDAKVGDDVLEPVETGQVGSSRRSCSSRAAEHRGTEIEDAASHVLCSNEIVPDTPLPS